MAEIDPSASRPKRTVDPGVTRRLFPWSEGQAKVVLAVMAVVLVAAIAAAIIFGVSLRAD